MKPIPLATLVRTVLSLNPRQVWGRVAQRLSPAFPCASTLSAVPDEVLEPERFRKLSFHNAGGQDTKAVQEIRQGRFSFYGWSKALGRPGTDWLLGERGQDRLFTIALHYHDFAPALARHDRPLFKTLINDWMNRCDPSDKNARPLAWNPYAASTRILNWCKAYAEAGAPFWEREPVFRERFLASLRAQGRFVLRNPEWHLLGNHLIRDALGMLCCLSFFGEGGRDSKKKFRKAEAWTRRWAADQVLKDHGHSERSPMYHVQVLEDLSLLQRFVGAETAAFLEPLLAGMRETLNWMRHPDGRIPLFNDAALNGATHPSTFGLGKRPQGTRHLRDTGLFIHHGPLYSVFFDVGKIGDRWQPGHAHADTLTIECSWRGKRLIVDPGTYGYDVGARRAYDRSTAAHNTLCVDGQDSSECWDIFRVGRRARPQGVKVSTQGPAPWAEAGHDGYRFLPGKPMHWRRLTAAPGRLLIQDKITGKSDHQVSGGLLLAPGWKAKTHKGGWEVVKSGVRVSVRVKTESKARLNVREAPYHPSFGVETTVQRLEVYFPVVQAMGLDWEIADA